MHSLTNRYQLLGDEVSQIYALLVLRPVDPLGTSVPQTTESTPAIHSFYPRTPSGLD